MLTRRYTTAGRIDSVIDLEKLRSGTKSCLERDASRFLDLTYLTEDLHRMLRALSQRFGQESNAPADSTGLILAEGVKGQGKSHTLLLAYHLFSNLEPASPWMERHGYAWAPPRDTIVLVEKFTDQYLPFDSLWTGIGGCLGVTWPQDRPPSLNELRDALRGRHLLLIFDELERGITNISDPARQSQNLSFLQMISEEANRSRQVTLVAAIYDGAKEPGMTLKRIPRVELRFRKAEDRAAIVRHRLFSNAASYDRNVADHLIRSYVNTWLRMGVQATDDYVNRLRSSFPFLPELIDLIFERMGGGQAFQGTRGALGLLGAMLDAGGAHAGLLTGAHCRLTDQACADRLQDLDPAGTTISCAAGNLRELENQPYAVDIASATLLASLVPTGHGRGLTKDELIRHVAEPDCDPNQFQSTLDAFQRYGSYFHKEEDRFYFDVQENENAKVELEALRSGSEETARQQVKETWLKDLFKESQQAVVYLDAEAARTALNAMPTKGPRFVLAPRRLSNPERHDLYRGVDFRNQVLLLEPRDERASHLTNPDLLAAARRYAAANALALTAKNPERRDRYEKIAGRERKQILDTLKQAGLVYIKVEAWAEHADQSTFEIESLGQACSREEIVTHLRTQVYSQPYFVEHIRDRLPTALGQTVGQVDRLYRTTLGFPVPLKEDMIAGAVRSLVEERETRSLGIHGPRGRSFCGEPVALTPAELDDAILAEPWVGATTPSVPSRPSDLPVGQPPSDILKPPSVQGAPTPHGLQVEEIGTPQCGSPAELRQQVAMRISGIDGADVQQASFRVLTTARNVELSGFSSGLRGALSGMGTLDVQIEITCPGPLTKADVEARCEQLPQISQASYSARLRVARRDEVSS